MVEVSQPWAGVGLGAGPATAVTTYVYDVQDHLESLTDAEGNTTTYETSDRDLLTREESPVSGVTVHTYSPGGELAQTTDARGVTTLRTHDALDRLVSVDLPGEAFDTAFTYDDPATPFSLGRLSAITRGAGTTQATEVHYAYDRFGRTVRDGSVTFTHDAHGNPLETRHELASGTLVTLATGYDFADRPVSAAVTVDDGVSAPTAADLVTGAAYASGGPLTELVRGNGITETRSRDGRYRLTRLEATAGASAASPGPRLDWSHTWDPVGNLLTVTDALGGSPRTYGYQDITYYLLQGDGPWGTRSWSYDRIGNRLEASSQGAPADVYHYAPSGAGGNTPQLASIDLGAGGTRAFTFGPAGHLEEISGAGTPQDFITGTDSRHAAFDPDTGTAAAAGAATERVDWTYDGRSFLASSSPATLFEDGFESGGTTCWNAPAGSPGCATPVETRPVYTSEGLLRCLERSPGAGRTQVFLYFAGQPLAQLTLPPGGTPELLHLTTDHLGTPILATDAAGDLVWQGGFEPFGADWNGAAVAGMPLRFPGQWWDETWGTTAEEAVFYNVHRWYGVGVSQYSKADPIDEQVDPNRYYYSKSNPLLYTDPLGLLCQLSPALETCLSRIFGFPVQQIKVFDHSKLPGVFTGGRTFTLPGQIHLPGACRAFFSYPKLILHEYYHVVDQWGTGRMTLPGYLAEGGFKWLKGDDPHGDNVYEREAENFATTHQQNLKDCVKCVDDNSGL